MDTPELTLPSLPADFAVILFGLECLSTAIVLKELLVAGVPIRLICIAGRASIPLLRGSRRRTLPLAPTQSGPQSVTHMAHSAGIELWRIGDLKASEVHDALDAVEADLVMVACFNRLIPARIYEHRKHGGINMHPSLLPVKRGPDPLFWMFKNEDADVGATVHRLTPRFDAGSILAQERSHKPDGISEAELDASLSLVGARLLVQAAKAVVSETTTERPQVESKATWAPHPDDDDFHVDLSQSARGAFNFVKGVEGRGRPITINMKEQTYEIRRVHHWSPIVDPSAPTPEGSTTIEFAEGSLVASLSALE